MLRRRRYPLSHTLQSPRSPQRLGLALVSHVPRQQYELRLPSLKRIDPSRKVSVTTDPLPHAYESTPSRMNPTHRSQPHLESRGTDGRNQKQILLKKRSASPEGRSRERRTFDGCRFFIPMRAPQKQPACEASIFAGPLYNAKLDWW